MFETRLEKSTAQGCSFNEDVELLRTGPDGPVALRHDPCMSGSRRPHGKAARSSKRTRIALEQNDVSPDDVPSS
jgi:hypothetical protein